MTQEEAEAALDNGRLWCMVSWSFTNRKYWKCRRNGRTKTWAREPKRFRIPIKAGFKTHGYVTENSKPPIYVISDHAPITKT